MTAKSIEKELQNRESGNILTPFWGIWVGKGRKKDDPVMRPKKGSEKVTRDGARDAEGEGGAPYNDLPWATPPRAKGQGTRADGMGGPRSRLSCL